MLTSDKTDDRQVTERRINDRRQDANEFDSPQWIQHMKRTYVSWPKFDRRETSRRSSERRKSIQESLDSLNSPYKHRIDYFSDLFSKEEKLFFMDLFKDKKS
ncbi:MAG: hypothetical protein KAI22_05895 [Gammaproteobacteria bacterium]|nr:hypothetical protein [Gammaproteobacteria bacterium]